MGFMLEVFGAFGFVTRFFACCEVVSILGAGH